MADNWLSSGLNRLMGVPNATPADPVETAAAEAAASTSNSNSNDNDNASSSEAVPAKADSDNKTIEAGVAEMSIGSVPPLPAPNTQTPSKSRSKKKFVFWKGKRNQSSRREGSASDSKEVRGAMHPPPASAVAAAAADADAGAGAEDSADAAAATAASKEEKPQKPNRAKVRENNFRRLLEDESIDMEALRRLSWSGVPMQLRAQVWQLLMGYLPNNKARRLPTLRKRRDEFRGYVEQHYNVPDEARTENEMVILRQIIVDLPRTCPKMPLFQNKRVQKSLERILYIWAIRHPASGYVQGINDIATPFLLVFICALLGLDHIEDVKADAITDKHFELVEADAFWCLTKLIDGIQDHFTAAQRGIQQRVHDLKELIATIDAPLHDHFEEQGLQFIQFSFRWFNCLLMRELPLSLILRLWDTYLSEERGEGFKSFHLYTCAAFLMHWQKDLRTLPFQDLVMFLQHLPTENWTERDVETIVSQAFVYKTLYHDAKAHLR